MQNNQLSCSRFCNRFCSYMQHNFLQTKTILLHHNREFKMQRTLLLPVILIILIKKTYLRSFSLLHLCGWVYLCYVSLSNSSRLGP